MSPSSSTPARGPGGDLDDGKADARSTFSSTRTTRGNVVYVYVGKGAGARSALSAARALERSLPLASVRTLSTQALLEGSWAKGTAAAAEEEEGEAAAAIAGGAAAAPAAAAFPPAAALVMPGGADLPYVEDLTGRGNDVIREFVRDSGGTYLGLCAGAYYACSRVEFEPASSTLRVVGDRPGLSFFPGIATGAVVPGFEYETEAGAAATRLRWRRRGGGRSGGRSGGRAARGARGEGEEWKQLEDGNDDDEEEGEWRECLDYCNGGPVFVLRGEAEEEKKGEEASSTPSSSSSCSRGRVPDECELADGVSVEVLARYDDDGGGGASEGAAPRSSSPSSRSSPAVAAAAEGGAAAVRCTVGRGVAVLCGTHPELSPAGEWLLASPPPCSSSSEPASSASASEARGNGGITSTAVSIPPDTKVSVLVRSLDEPAAAKRREAYWESLLDAAGLGGLRG